MTPGQIQAERARAALDEILVILGTLPLSDAKLVAANAFVAIAREHAKELGARLGNAADEDAVRDNIARVLAEVTRSIRAGADAG